MVLAKSYLPDFDVALATLEPLCPNGADHAPAVGVVGVKLVVDDLLHLGQLLHLDDDLVGAVVALSYQRLQFRVEELPRDVDELVRLVKVLGVEVQDRPEERPVHLMG
jgi:hypothetical protein